MSEVSDFLNSFRREMRNRESAEFALLGARWKVVESNLEGHIRALVDQIRMMREAGKAPTKGQIYRMERYQSLLMQVRYEAARYEDYAARVIAGEQVEYGRLGAEMAQSILSALLPEGLNVMWNRLPVGAVETMIGMTADGSPLFDVLHERALAPDMVEGLTNALVEATALGYNPRKTAYKMRDGLTAGLNKALVIARTEQLRVFRTATMETYRSNDDIVDGWEWRSARQVRTCPACWAKDDGTVHPLSEDMNDHVCGRCVAVPHLKSWKALGFENVPEVAYDRRTGEEVFNTLPAEKQLKIMGQKRLDYLAEGGNFSDLVTMVDHRIWGTQPRVTTLEELGINE